MPSIRTVQFSNDRARWRTSYRSLDPFHTLARGCSATRPTVVWLLNGVGSVRRRGRSRSRALFPAFPRTGDRRRSRGVLERQTRSPPSRLCGASALQVLLRGGGSSHRRLSQPEGAQGRKRSDWRIHDKGARW